MKKISKAIIIESNLEQHILKEKEVLEITNFPFIMQLEKTFQDDVSIYFLVEYIRGVDMIKVITIYMTRHLERWVY